MLDSKRYASRVCDCRARARGVNSVVSWKRKFSLSLFAHTPSPLSRSRSRRLVLHQVGVFWLGFWAWGYSWVTLCVWSVAV